MTGKYLIRDRESRYGTFVNGEPVTECELRSGDRIRLGRGGGADLVFLAADDDRSVSSKSTTGARDDLRQITALLEGFRALGSGRVLQEVLALVLDAAIEISGAERAFIMLVDRRRRARVQAGARARTSRRSPTARSQTSRKIPEEVFRIGKTQAWSPTCSMAGWRTSTWARVALGIRNVVCVPLNFVHYVEAAEARGDDRRIGVLYLDSRERGTLLSDATRAALETLAAEASVAIENARLYRDKLEKARMEQEMRIAAEIQQALLPKPRASLGFVEAAAASIPCRSIGGDFFDYLDEPGATFGFTLGDVAGKGPPAALMSALMQGMFASQAQYRRRAGVGRHAHEQGAVPARPRVAVRDAAVRDHPVRRQADLLQRRAQPADGHRQARRPPARRGRPRRRPARVRAVRARNPSSSTPATPSWSSATACPRR